MALAAPSRALAQACCAGASVLNTGRLAPHEDAVAGVLARGTMFHGSMTRDGSYVGAPGGVVELELEQALLGTIRVLRHGQLTALVPFVETYRAVPGLSEMGGGLGDVQLGARYDFIEPGASPTWPGVALSLRLTLPTGVAPEDASSPLATGATGTGSVLAGGDVIVERGFGDAFFQVAGGAEWRSPRVVAEMHTQRGPRLSASGAVGYSFPGGLVGAITLSYRAETDARLEGKEVEGSGSELTSAGVSFGYSLSDDWRIQAALSADVAAAPFARNQPTGATLSFTLLRAAW